jgi:PHD-finger
MNASHTVEWYRSVHMLTWYCDMGHDQRQLFSDKADYEAHIRASHGNLTASQRIARIKRSKNVASRELFTCPLCECVPQKLAAVHPQQRLEEVSGLLGKHVASHIKALSLLSFRLLPHNDEGEDIHENSSNLLEDMSMDIQHELSGSEQRVELSRDAELSESFEDIPVTDRHTNEAISIEDIIVHATPELADSELWTFLPAFDYLNKEQDKPRQRKTIADEREERQAKRLQHIQAADSGSDSEDGLDNTCIFCKQGEDDDPSEDFEPYLTCSVGGGHSHQQCARENNAMNDENDAEKWRCPTCVTNNLEVQSPLRSRQARNSPRQPVAKIVGFAESDEDELAAVFDEEPPSKRIRTSRKSVKRSKWIPEGRGGGGRHIEVGETAVGTDTPRTNEDWAERRPRAPRSTMAPTCGPRLVRDFLPVSRGVQRPESKASKPRNSAPRLVRDLLPASRGVQRPNSHSIFAQPLISEGRLRKRKSPTGEPQPPIEKRRRKTTPRALSPIPDARQDESDSGVSSWHGGSRKKNGLDRNQLGKSEEKRAITSTSGQPKTRKRRPSDIPTQDTQRRSARQKQGLDARSNQDRRETRVATYPRQSSNDRSISPEPISRREHKRVASTQVGSSIALKKKLRAPAPLITSSSRHNRSSDRHSDSDASASEGPSRPHLHKFTSTDNGAMSPAKGHSVRISARLKKTKLPEEGEDVEGLEEDVTRCICGHAEYPGPPTGTRVFAQRRTSKAGSKDGGGQIIDANTSDTLPDDVGDFFIQCDNCFVWQHGGCVGLTNESMSPEFYYCEECKPEFHKLIRASDR